ncbi:MAG: tetratricopeptide repeat protein [Candidatus Omnitrophota bacterium]
MHKIILIFAFCILLLNTGVLFAEDTAFTPEYMFYKANILYEEGKYAEATSAYRNLLDKGFESGSLYYNLGNCYFKQGVLGQAILNYERAKQLIPRDRDLQSNYEYARSLLKVPPLEEKKTWLLQFMDNLYAQLTIDGITVLLCLIYVAFVLVIILGIVFKTHRLYTRILLSILIVFSVLSAVFLERRISVLGKEAIIISKKADAKFEPFDRATTHFTLEEGMKVRVLVRNNDWSKVERLDKKVGWVKNIVFEVIFTAQK